jgi:hypothetical protein
MGVDSQDAMFASREGQRNADMKRSAASEDTHQVAFAIVYIARFEHQ